MKSLLFSLIILLLSSFVIAQPPSTDIYLLDVAGHSGHFHLRNLVKVTDRDGYDNQPFFTHDGQHILFTSIREGTQSDIYRYSIKSGATARLTHTTESEYSPTVMYGDKFFSVVRVEGPDSLQRIWRFPLKGGKPKVVNKYIDRIGYHCWLDKKRLLAFRVEDPSTLEAFGVKDKLTIPISANGGRSLNPVPGEEAVTFVDKKSEDEWWIMRWDTEGEEMTQLIKTLPKVEDFCWTPDGYMLMGNEGKLYSFKPDVYTAWKEVANIQEMVGSDFYRLAMSPDGKKLALVVFRGERP